MHCTCDVAVGHQDLLVGGTAFLAVGSSPLREYHERLGNGGRC
jgi:hypothetical protein